jgi:hypothetical protein
MPVSLRRRRLVENAKTFLAPLRPTVGVRGLHLEPPRSWTATRSRTPRAATLPDRQRRNTTSRSRRVRPRVSKLTLRRLDGMQRIEEASL